MVRHAFNVVETAKKAGLSVDIHFGQPADIGTDNGYAAAHCLQCRETEGFTPRRDEKKVGNGENLFHLLLFSQKTDTVAYAQLAAAALRFLTVGAVAHHQQFRANPAFENFV